jgi:hypothetical protein
VTGEVAEKCVALATFRERVINYVTDKILNEDFRTELKAHVSDL